MQKKKKTNDVNDFVKQQSDIRKVSTKILKFSKFYETNKFTKRFFVSFMLGFIMAVISVLLVESTGLYVGGFAAFFQGTARFTRVALTKWSSLSENAVTIVYTILFWGQYLLLNVILFFFAWKKIGHEFAILSMVYIGSLQFFGFIFSTFTPFLENLNILGETATVNEELEKYHVKSLLFSCNVFPEAIPDDANNYDWSKIHQVIPGFPIDEDIVFTVESVNLVRIFKLFIYASIFALLNGICGSLLFITGSSTAGSDIVSVYLSQEKNKPVENILLFINISGLLSGITLGSFATAAIINPKFYCSWQYFLSGNLICSFVWAILYSFFLNAFFPWRKITKVEIYTEKHKEIISYLNSTNSKHSLSILSAVGGHSQNQIKIIISICQLVEIPRFVATVRTVDKNCLITAQYIDDVDGNITIKKQAK